jgi:acid phosphatase
MRQPFALLACVLLTACAGTREYVPPERLPLPPSAATAPAGCVPSAGPHNDLLAVLWMQTSAEYRALSVSAYRSAIEALKTGVADPRWTAELSQAAGYEQMPPAVVMDLDETVFDNTAFNAGRIAEGGCEPPMERAWDEWVARRAAGTVPGAAEFVRAARNLTDTRGRPVRVIFITNRECRARAPGGSPCPQREDTLANLRALGLDSPTLDEDLLLSGDQPDWDKDKTPRREAVARRFRIVQLYGDDIGDFAPGARSMSLAEREQARCRYDAYWGKRWIVLANPVYGSWKNALGSMPRTHLRHEAAATVTACPQP